MSQGAVKQWVDYTQGGDDGTNEPGSIQPILNGEDLFGDTTPPTGAGELNRGAQNLRKRTEVVRGVFEDTLYLRDADRSGLCLAGPGRVTWDGSTTGAHSGIIVTDDNLYLLPFLTPGAVQVAPVPPVASAFGTLILLNSLTNPGITVQSNRRSYEGGDKINVTVIMGGAPGTVSAALVTDAVQRSIVVTANNAQLSAVITALNALTADAPATQLVTATLHAGAAGTDLLQTPQVQQFIQGNYDAEAHAITPAALASFFATAGNRLAEGDSLCIQYASLIDTLPGPPTGGRRQSIPENSNTTIPAGSFFNSRVNPEKLVNALPICKVVDGDLHWVNGHTVLAGSTTVFVDRSDAGAVFVNALPNWADGTTNPAAPLQTVLDTLVTDLATGDGAGKIHALAATHLAAGTVGAQLADLDAKAARIDIVNSFTQMNAFLQTQDMRVGVQLGEDELASDAAALNARVVLRQRDSVNVLPILTKIRESRPTGVKAGSRTYTDQFGGTWITQNCYYDNATQQWSKDLAGIASVWWLSHVGTLIMQVKAAGSSDPAAPNTFTPFSSFTNAPVDFAGAASSQIVQLLHDGRLDMTSSVDGSWGNPLGSTPIANILCAKNICRAWIVAKTDSVGGIDPALSRSFNCTPQLNAGAPSIFTINFSAAMNSDYACIGIIADAPGLITNMTRSTTSVELTCQDRTGAPLSLTTGVYVLNVLFFGLQV